jgi:hypothetical protein
MHQHSSLILRIFIFIQSSLAILSYRCNRCIPGSPRLRRISHLSPAQSSIRSTVELEKCLQREYATFFSPMDRKFYADDVTFEDPLTSFSGVDKYQNNVDLLGGRTALGNILFKDAFIVLHNIEIINETTLQTRWTLQLTVKALPWKVSPR